jgi:hypothetical protein
MLKSSNTHGNKLKVTKKNKQLTNYKLKLQNLQNTIKKTKTRKNKIIIIIIIIMIYIYNKRKNKSA